MSDPYQDPPKKAFCRRYRAGGLSPKDPTPKGRCYVGSLRSDQVGEPNVKSISEIVSHLSRPLRQVTRALPKGEANSDPGLTKVSVLSRFFFVDRPVGVVRQGECDSNVGVFDSCQDPPKKLSAGAIAPEGYRPRTPLRKAGDVLGRVRVFDLLGPRPRITGEGKPPDLPGPRPRITGEGNKSTPLDRPGPRPRITGDENQPLTLDVITPTCSRKKIRDAHSPSSDLDPSWLRLSAKPLSLVKGVDSSDRPFPKSISLWVHQLGLTKVIVDLIKHATAGER